MRGVYGEGKWREWMLTDGRGQDLYIAFSGGAFPSGHFLTLISNLYTPKSRTSSLFHRTPPLSS